MRGAIYSRVSTSEQQTNRQVSDLIIYAKLKGFVIEEDDIYEEYISGYKTLDERSELKRLKKKIDDDSSFYSAIFVWEISRIARDPIQGNIFINYFSGNNIPIYVKEPEIVSLKDGNRDGMFTIYFTILMEFANTEALLIKKRSRSGIREKIKNGKGVGFINLPYGYKKDNKGILIIDEEEEVIIKRIFDLSYNGYGSKKIASILNADEVKTRYNKKYTNLINFKETQKPPINPANIKWKDGTIYTILTNTIYKGERKVKTNPDDKSNFSEFDYFKTPAIIDKDLWDEVQIKLSSRKDTSPKNTKFVYILKDKLKCSFCGNSMFARNRSNGKDRFYMCSSKRSQSRECLSRGFSIEYLDGLVLEEIFKYEFNEKSMGVIQENNNMLSLNLNNLIKILKSLNQDEESILKNIENSKIAYLKDPISLEKYYFDLKETYTKDLNKLRKEIEETKRKINLIETNVIDYSDINNLVKQLKKSKFDREMCAKIVDISIDKIYFYSIDEHFALITIFFKTSIFLPKLDLIIYKKEKKASFLNNRIIVMDFIYDEFGRIKNPYQEVNKFQNELIKKWEIKPFLFDSFYHPNTSNFLTYFE